MWYRRLEAFLVSGASANSLSVAGLLPYDPQDMCETDLPVPLPTAFDHLFQQMARLAYCVPPSLHHTGTGILTCCPSTTLFSLALGTD